MTTPFSQPLISMTSIYMEYYDKRPRIADIHKRTGTTIMGGAQGRIDITPVIANRKTGESLYTFQLPVWAPDKIYNIQKVQVWVPQRPSSSLVLPLWCTWLSSTPPCIPWKFRGVCCRGSTCGRPVMTTTLILLVSSLVSVLTWSTPHRWLVVYSIFRPSASWSLSPLIRSGRKYARIGGTTSRISTVDMLSSYLDVEW